MRTARWPPARSRSCLPSFEASLYAASAAITAPTSSPFWSSSRANDHLKQTMCQIRQQYIESDTDNIPRVFRACAYFICKKWTYICACLFVKRTQLIVISSADGVFWRVKKMAPSYAICSHVSLCFLYGSKTVTQKIWYLWCIAANDVARRNFLHPQKFLLYTLLIWTVAQSFRKWL